MKRWIPTIAVVVFAAYVLSGLRAPKEKSEFNIAEFGRLPVLLNGRVQPFDSVGLNSLLSMQGKRIVRIPPAGAKAEGRSFSQWMADMRNTKKMSATEWLLEVMVRPDRAATYPTFRVQHPDLQGLLGLTHHGLDYVSFEQIEPKLEEIERQARQVAETKKDAQLRTPYEKDLLHLYESLLLYRRLSNSLKPQSSTDFAAELVEYERVMKPGVEALKKREAGEAHDEQALQGIVGYFRIYQRMEQLAYPLVVPTDDPKKDRDAWTKMGGSLMEAMRSGDLNPAVHQLAAIATTYQKGDAAGFNKAVDTYRTWLVGHGLVAEIDKGRREYLFNHFEPFYRCSVVYVVALLAGAFFWLNFSELLRKTSYYLLVLAFVAHTLGLGFRMFLEGRPPVTNLYSSAIFVGWGAVLLGIVLERIFRDGIGSVASAAIGFSSLIIAHHLSLSGDTMEMLRAVLDTNFWLATHVVVITTGYSSTYVAGFLGIVFILRGVLTRGLSVEAGKGLNRMIYGIVCFSTLFSFVGTVLGGIWADQSWGRFWGWDPKENGALLLVIWNAIILHARWGGMIRERGMAVLAVFGNIVTSLSWFGVNMLGVGLHSYGFMDAAFAWLVGFAISQLIIMGLGMLPLHLWRSGVVAPGSSPAKPGASSGPASTLPKPGPAAA